MRRSSLPEELSRAVRNTNRPGLRLKKKYRSRMSRIQKAFTSEFESRWARVSQSGTAVSHASQLFCYFVIDPQTFEVVRRFQGEGGVLSSAICGFAFSKTLLTHDKKINRKTNEGIRSRERCSPFG